MELGERGEFWGDIGREPRKYRIMQIIIRSGAHSLQKNDKELNQEDSKAQSHRNSEEELPRREEARDLGTVKGSSHAHVIILYELHFPPLHSTLCTHHVSQERYATPHNSIIQDKLISNRFPPFIRRLRRHQPDAPGQRSRP